MEIIYLISGILLGVLFAWLLLNSRFEKEKGIPAADVEELRIRINEITLAKGKSEAQNQILNENLGIQNRDLISLRDINTKLSSDLASLNADHQNLRAKFEEYKLEVQQIRDKFTAEFKNIANELLDEKSKKFTEQNKTNIDQILRPLSERIKDFEKKVEDVYVTDSKERAGLIQQIKTLHELNQQMSKDAANLTNALKGQSKAQGNWGEYILERIMEKSGLVKGREYVVQQSFTTEENKRLQPDIVVYLPDNKCLIIDSKVSLVAYERYCSAEEDTNRIIALREHVSSIRRHIKDLSSKSYQNLYEIKTLDFVLLFMPIEPSFSLAVQNDPELFNEAFEHNIVIVSPSTLLATLRTIASIWRQENQNKNALEIARHGGAMYDKIQSIIEDLLELGKKITSSRATYDDVMKKLYTGGGNLLKRAEAMRQLGAKATKTMPPAVLDKIEEGSEDDFLIAENK